MAQLFLSFSFEAPPSCLLERMYTVQCLQAWFAMPIRETMVRGIRPQLLSFACPPAQLLCQSLLPCSTGEESPLQRNTFVLKAVALLVAVCYRFDRSKVPEDPLRKLRELQQLISDSLAAAAEVAKQGGW